MTWAISGMALAGMVLGAGVGGIKGGGKGAGIGAGLGLLGGLSGGALAGVGAAGAGAAGAGAAGAGSSGFTGLLPGMAGSLTGAAAPTAATGFGAATPGLIGSLSGAAAPAATTGLSAAAPGLAGSLVSSAPTAAAGTSSFANLMDPLNKVNQVMSPISTLKNTLGGAPTPPVQPELLPQQSANRQEPPELDLNSLLVSSNANKQGGYPGMMMASSGNMSELDILRKLGLVPSNFRA